MNGQFNWHEWRLSFSRYLWDEMKIIDNWLCVGPFVFKPPSYNEKKKGK